MAVDELTRTAAPPRPRTPQRTPPDRAILASAAALLLALAAVVPIARGIVPTWLAGAFLAAAAVWAAGATARALLRRRGLVPLVQLLAWIGASTACYSTLAASGVLPGAPGLLWVVPPPPLVEEIPALIATAVEQITVGSAPLAPGASLTFVLVSASGLLALLLDVLAISLRLPVAAIAVAVTVWSVPPAIVGGDVRFLQLFAITGSALLLLAADRRRRDPGARTAATATLAAVAIAASLVVTPLLPEPVMRGYGPGSPTRIDASLDLGDDLRRFQEIEVLRYTAPPGRAPYLRVATLSTFDGGRWAPDSGASTPVSSGMPPVVTGSWDGTPVPAEELVIDVQITGLRGSYLPVPFPATSLEGADAEWSVLHQNATVFGGDSRGERYQVVAAVPDPTREQAQAAAAQDSEGVVPDTTRALPRAPELEQVRQVALEVTAAETTDYDRLTALQRWFRGGAFEYSLDAPVAEGFDGTGVEAMAEFLDRRAGYCVHFASTFAVMARTLDMPARVVVGYLPGLATGERIDGRRVYSVSSSQLHAWPEVFFDGIGWVPFDPTPGLGTATVFRPAVSSVDGPTGDDPVPSASAAPAPAPTASPLRPDEDSGGGITGTGDGSGSDGWGAALGWATGIAALLAAPGIARAALRARRLRAASRGDARQAWRELVDTVLDAGVEAPPHESPRTFADRLAAERGVPPDALAPLVAGIEAASYGPGDPDAGDLAAPLRRVRRTILPSAARRAVALVAPRSFLAPGRFGARELAG